MDFQSTWGDANFPAVSKVLQSLDKHKRVRIESAGVSTVYPGMSEGLPHAKQ